jgi:predicted nucleotidyltransferase
MDVLSQLVDRLRKAYGDRIVSVVLYGSAVSGNHQPKFSDYNVLCVLAEVTLREMAQSEEVFRWWRERGSPSPLLLSERELMTSTDCFAIEFHDIKTQHRILYGKDVVAPLAVDDSFYRAQVEHDLRAKLLRLRQKISGMASSDEMADSLSTFCVLFRHALHLIGTDASMEKREVIAQAGRTFGFDTQPFELLLDLREQRINARQFDPAAHLAGYLQGIGAVIEAVDALEKK